MPDEINAAFFIDLGLKMMVEQSYAEEPRGECAEEGVLAGIVP